MKTLCLLAALGLSAVAGNTFAAETTAQQQKMTQCNHQAGEKSLKGADRKTFMSACLKKESGNVEKMTPQQIRMKTCNAQAADKALKSDERKQFMSNCLKKS